MATYSIDRCANPTCRKTVDLDWDAVACPCGAVVTCEGCEPSDICEDCRVEELHHCDGCGEDYDLLTETHVGHGAAT